MRTSMVLALLLCACQGDIGDRQLLPDETPSIGPADPGVAGESRLRPLNQREYRNAIDALLGVDVTLELPRDQRGGDGFDTDGHAYALAADAAEQYFVAAERLASEAIPHFAHCEGADALACIDDSLEDWLLLAFRRPVAASSLDRLRGLLEGVQDRREALANVALFTFSSPQFLFHYKSPGDAIDGYELADRLAFLLWAAPPDAALLQAAATDLLDDVGLERELDRMMNDPRAERFVDAFVGLWLGVDRLLVRDASDEDRALFEDMVEETHRFARDVLRDSPVNALVSARYSFVNARLARLYGMDDTGLDEDRFTRVELPEERQGLLTQAGVLAAHSPTGLSDPIRRGVWISHEFLCSSVRGSAPPEVEPLGASFSEGQTPREVLAIHRESPACAGCHAHTDPYGLALETFDAFGSYRPIYPSGRDVDPSGELIDGRSFEDAIELNALIVESGELPRCVAQHVGTYALGRTLHEGETALLRDAIGDPANVTLRDIVRALVRSPLFRAAPGLEL